MTRAVILLLLAPIISSGATARQASGVGAGSARNATSVKHSAARVSLAPKFSPGETFRYHIVFGTTTAVAHTGLATDHQAPSSEVVNWDATLRFEVLPAASGNGGAGLRLVYEKSAADIQGDTFDPGAAAMQEEYQKLEGKTLEFAFDAAGKLINVTGLEGVVGNDAALQTARQWITQFVAGPGAPAGGVSVGQKWTTDQPADALPVTGMVWRSASQYVRDEPCPASPSNPITAAADNAADAAEGCAVIVTDLNLVQPKAVRDATPEALRKNDVRTAGTWNGSAHSQSYISLRSGLVVSVTQTGTETMDVIFTTEHLESLRYAGTIASRSQITLEPGAITP